MFHVEHGSSEVDLPRSPRSIWQKGERVELAITPLIPTRHALSQHAQRTLVMALSLNVGDHSPLAESCVSENTGLTS